MENEPLPSIPQYSQGPFLVRHKRALIGVGVLVVIGIMLLGHHATNPQTVQPAPTQRVSPAQLQPDPAPQPTASAQQSPVVQPVQPEQQPPPQYAVAAAPPQKSKAQEAQDELRYRSLFQSTVIAKPVEVYAPKPETKSNDEGGSPESNSPENGATADRDNTAGGSPTKTRNPLDFDPNQTLYTLPEGTIIETVLTNKIEGEMEGEVDCMVTTDVYAPNSRIVVIPQGARVIGEASKVAAFGQQRLAVTFRRIIVPGPPMYSIPLDVKPSGLDQVGANGLGSPFAKINSHYFSIFGASMAIGLVGGLSQIGSYGSGGYSPVYGLMNGFSESTAESTSQVLSRFLNRLPAISVPPGVRVKIMLAGDLQIPAIKE